MTNVYQQYLTVRQAQEKQATELVSVLSALAASEVAVSFFGERVSFDVSAILTQHTKAGVEVADTLALAKALVAKGLSNASLDLGQAVKAGQSADDFNSGAAVPATDVVLYGFGRIGRILARLLMSRPASDKGLQLKAIVVRPAGEGDLAKRASLLERDSVHGWFNGSVLSLIHI